MPPPIPLVPKLGAVDATFWPALAGQVAGELAARTIALRDTVLLLPHAGLLGVARTAFGRRGGWQPRIETVQTLAAALAAPPVAPPGVYSGEPDTDRLQAAALLRRQPWAAQWAQHDPRAFAAATAALHETAQALCEAAVRHAPADRAAWWDGLRQALPPLQGPGASERLMARLAVEWAASAPPPPSDVLDALRPAAWVVIGATGEGPALARRLAQAGSSSVFELQADPDPVHPFDAVSACASPKRLRASSLEDEALAAAWSVIQALDGGAQSVALVALDRLVVRRIRALLERAGVALDDETGWTLSTTRAAAELMAWLRAAAHGAGRDAVVEALRAEGQDAAALDALEAAWRQQREAPSQALALLERWRERVDPGAVRPLPQWLVWLRERAPQLLQRLGDDAAGREVLRALRLEAAPGAAWRQAAQATALDLAGFTRWVDEVLERESWRPPAAPDAAVSIVTLQRAVLRPFDAVVFPGCDAQRLGTVTRSPGLLGGSLAAEFGIADAAQRERVQQAAFALLLRAPRLTLIRRTHDGSEPLAPSPLLERAMLARRRLGAPVLDETVAALPTQAVAAAPVRRPAPTMAGALPLKVSATVVQTLRDCPYRFFARSALGLHEGRELDDALDRSDYGRWVHGLLERFHTQRSGQHDHAELLAAAEASQAALGLDAAALLPYRVAFERFAQQYLEWLKDHEAEGWRFHRSELSREKTPPQLDGVVLHGRIDRLDRHADGRVMVVDYKTGSADRVKLKQRVKQPFEDTQLAFYAALLDADEAQLPAHAIYLALSERDKPEPIEHLDVARSAAALVDGLADELAALRAGAPAPALGEGDTCRHCEMRGLCRRDHWSGTT